MCTAAVSLVRAPCRSRGQRQQPRERRHRHGRRSQQPRALALLQPQIGQAATNDLITGGTKAKELVAATFGEPE